MPSFLNKLAKSRQHSNLKKYFLTNTNQYLAGLHPYSMIVYGSETVARES